MHILTSGGAEEGQGGGKKHILSANEHTYPQHGMITLDFGFDFELDSTRPVNDSE